jgi:hypothetical protein
MTGFEPDANDSPTLEVCFGRSAAHAAAEAFASGGRRASPGLRPGRWLRSCLRLLAS